MKSAIGVCVLAFISVAVRAHPLLSGRPFYPVDPLFAVDPPFNGDPHFAVDPPVRVPPPPLPERQCLLGCKPGDIIKKTDLKKVNSSLDDLANDGWQKRKCMVGFANVADKPMNNPRFYIQNGMIKTMPQFDLPAGRTVLLLFTKTDWSAYGTKGVMSYDVVGADVKVALMWYVPKNTNKPFKYSSKVLPKTTATDKNLYNLMEKEARTGDGAIRTDRWLEVSTEGVMYPAEKSKVILRVDTSPPTTPAPPTTTTTPKPTTTTKSTTTRSTTTTTPKPTTTTTPKPTTTTTPPTTTTSEEIIGY